MFFESEMQDKGVSGAITEICEGKNVTQNIELIHDFSLRNPDIDLFYSEIMSRGDISRFYAEILISKTFSNDPTKSKKEERKRFLNYISPDKDLKNILNYLKRTEIPNKEIEKALTNFLSLFSIVEMVTLGSERKLMSNKFRKEIELCLKELHAKIDTQPEPPTSTKSCTIS